MAGTPQLATEKPKKMYYAEFTANLMDGNPRRYSSYVLARDRWKAKDGLTARVGSKIRHIRIKKVQNGAGPGPSSGGSFVLEV